MRLLLLLLLLCARVAAQEDGEQPRGDDDAVLVHVEAPDASSPHVDEPITSVTDPSSPVDESPSTSLSIDENQPVPPSEADSDPSPAPQTNDDSIYIPGVGDVPLVDSSNAPPPVSDVIIVDSPHHVDADAQRSQEEEEQTPVAEQSATLEPSPTLTATTSPHVDTATVASATPSPSATPEPPHVDATMTPSLSPVPVASPTNVEDPPATDSTVAPTLVMCRMCGAPVALAGDGIAPSSPAWGSITPLLPSAAHACDASYMGQSAGCVHASAGQLGLTPGGAGSDALSLLAFAATSKHVKTEMASTGNSFVAGYAQHAASCSSCGGHIGFRYDKLPPTGAKAQFDKPAPGKASANIVSVSASNAAANAAKTPVRPALHVAPYAEVEEVARLAEMKDVCIIAPRGWWTYELCHRARVREYHREPDGRITADWSMGSFNPKHNVERTHSPGPDYYTSHFYSNGQRCDETGRGRQTEVQFFCCPHLTEAKPVIEAIDEPSTCKYKMRVCVPSLCVPVQTTEDVQTTPASDGSSRTAAGGSTESATSRATETAGHGSVRGAHASDAAAAATDASLTPTNERAADTTSSTASSAAASSQHGAPRASAPSDAPASFFMLAAPNLVPDTHTGVQALLDEPDWSTGTVPVRFSIPGA